VSSIQARQTPYGGLLVNNKLARICERYRHSSKKGTREPVPNNSLRENAGVG
jgi:hypothetical protein